MDMPERMAGKRMEALSLARAFAEGLLDMATVVYVYVCLLWEGQERRGREGRRGEERIGRRKKGKGGFVEKAMKKKWKRAE